MSHTQGMEMVYFRTLLISMLISAIRGTESCVGDHCSQDLSSMLQTSWDLSAATRRVVPSYASRGIQMLATTSLTAMLSLIVIAVAVAYGMYINHKRKDSIKEEKKEWDKLQKAVNLLQDAESHAAGAMKHHVEDGEPSTPIVRLPDNIVKEISDGFKEFKTRRKLSWPF